MKIQDVNGDGVALDGIDPVSKFEDNPERGKSTLSFSIGETTYYFASEENLAKFKEHPENYLRGPNELATKEMVGNAKKQKPGEQKNRWEERTEDIGKNSFASGREQGDTPVQHEGKKLKGKNNK